VTVYRPIFRRRWGEEIGWALDTSGAAVQDVRVDCRRRYILVAEKLLNGSNVVARFEHVRGETARKEKHGRRGAHDR
jgi:hypothetical protein